MNTEEFEQAIERLQRPFAVRDIDWVPNFTYPKDGGYQEKVIAVAPYVRRESVITRFNVVCGAGEWENIMEPLANFGLYHGIAINHNGYWVRKYDGAQIDKSDNNHIDAVKAVVSRSIRRAGEMWGVGLYLQFIPQLYAIKRPSDYYDAEYKWEDKKNNLAIRWDPPSIPKQYLPVYMTPEQYVRMKRILKYFDADRREKAEDLIAAYETDPDSVDYETAETVIGVIEDRILKALKKINKAAVSVPNKPKNTKDEGSSKQDSSPDRSQQDRSNQPEPQQASGESQQQATGEIISPDQFKEYTEIIKGIERADEAQIFHNEDWIQKHKDAANAHHKGQKKITVEEFDQLQAEAQEIWDLIDDDLPF